MKYAPAFILCSLLTLTACFGLESENRLASPTGEAATAATAIVAEPSETAAATATLDGVAADFATATPVAATETPAVAATPTATEADSDAAAQELTEITPTPSLAATAPTDADPALAAVPVTQIQLAPVLSGGLSNPVYLTHAGDPRLFVVEQPGTIRIIVDGELIDAPFLDIRERVGSRALEQGLLSMAFHREYAGSGDSGQGHFFVNYTNLNGDTVIARYQVSSEDPNRADPDSEIILLTISQPYGNHNGGQLAFGPDGYLYVGMGDGGSRDDPSGNGQNPGTLLGTLLRLDTDSQDNVRPYGIPESNPFVGQAGKREEIWAIGLRNPWRFSFDSATGDLYIGDVGQNNWEEIHFRAAGSSGGENYGWNIIEGSHCFQDANCDQGGLQLPIFEYSHGRQGCSVTGGYVYRGQAFPELTGNYFAGDFCSGIIWSLSQSVEGSWTANEVLRSGLQISSLGEDASGELYVLDHSGGVFQIRP